MIRHGDLARAIQSPDRWLIRMRYVDAKQQTSERLISPVMLSSDRSRVLALCLTREDWRWFRVSDCQNVRLVNANLYSMPWSPSDDPYETSTLDEPTAPTHGKRLGNRKA